MRVRVRFSYDARTGQVTFFQVDDVTGASPEADHDDRHDQITAEVAGVIERRALIDEVAPGQPAVRTAYRHGPDEAELTAEERDRDA